MLYFIQAGEAGPVKIGLSSNVTKRVNGLQTASPLKLSVIRLIEGDRRAEKALHWEFRHLRVKNEWFTFDARMLDIDPAGIVVAVEKPPKLPRVFRAPMPARQWREAPRPERPASISNVRFTECLDAIGWSARELTGRLKCDTNLTTRWKRGTAAVPQSIANWIEALSAEILAVGPPDNWRTR